MLGLLTNTFTRASISKQFILAIFESVYLPKATQVSSRDSAASFSKHQHQPQHQHRQVTPLQQPPVSTIATIAMTAVGGRNRSRVLREMNQEADHSMISVVSSTGSGHGTISADTTSASRAQTHDFPEHSINNDFSPDNSDIFASTGILDHRYQLNPNPKTQTPQQQKAAASELRDTAKKYGRWSPRREASAAINSSAMRHAFPDFTQAGPADFSLELPRTKPKARDTASLPPMNSHVGKRVNNISCHNKENIAARINPQTSRVTSSQRNTLGDVTGTSNNTFTVSQRVVTTDLSLTRSSRFTKKPMHAAVTPAEASTPTPAPALSTQTFSIPQEAATRTETINHDLPVLTRDGKVEAPPKPRQHRPVDGIEVPHSEEDLYRLINQLRSDFEKLAAQNTVMLRRNSDSAIGTSHDQSAQINQFEVHIQNMNSEITTIRQDLQNSKEDVESLGMSLQQRYIEIADLKDDYENLNMSLRQRDIEIAELRDRVARLEAQQPTENMTSAYLAVDIEAAKEHIVPEPISFAPKPRSRSRSNSENSTAHTVQDNISQHSVMSRVETVTQPIVDDQRPISPTQSDRPVSSTRTSRPASPITTSDLPRNARQIFEDLCTHKCSNCSVCVRLCAFNERSNTGAGLKRETVHVAKQIPVSQRTFETQEEQTLRPVQAPGRALAGVIKCLEDELIHIKKDHCRMTLAYHKRNPASERQYLVAASSELERLQEEIDRKSKQIYNLYDVLEGQKESGQMVDTSFDMTVVEEALPWTGCEEE